MTILALVLCFLLTTSCGTEALLERLGVPQEGDLMDILPLATAGPSPSPWPTAGAGSLPVTGMTPAPSGSGAGTGTPDQLQEQYVEDAWTEPGVLPRLKADIPGAEAVNQLILESFTPAAEDPMCRLHYACGMGAGRVLSILMVMEADNDWVEYTPYNIDMTTGQLLTGQELLALLKVDQEELSPLEQAAMGEAFTGLYGSAQDTTDKVFYDQQFARTTSVNNVELERLWFDDAGTLCFAGRIYALAGAEYYEQVLNVGWRFP